MTRLRPDEPNLLFHNEGPGPASAWSDAVAEAGVEGPPVSFSDVVFDFDNEGWEGLFVSGFSGGLAGVVLERLGQPHQGQLPRLYRNDCDGTFTDVTAAVGLDRIGSWWGWGRTSAISTTTGSSTCTWAPATPTTACSSRT